MKWRVHITFLVAALCGVLAMFATHAAFMWGFPAGHNHGWLISIAVGAIAAAAQADISPTIGLDSVLLATLFSMAVGLVFGVYPANRAANLEPVEALRYE